MSLSAAPKYRAFLSYSHIDARRGVRLHRQLEAYRIDRDLAGRVTAMGLVPSRLRPIFRDRDEFAAGATLTEQTIAALDASAALVVLCTPASAKSAYVNNEIRLFRSRHPDRPVIPVIAAGTPDHPERECFAPALRFEVTPDGAVSDRPVTVLAADLRDAGDGEQLTLAKVVARLTGFGTDEIFRREQRAQRRRLRAWIAGLSAVALGLGGLALWAEINRREAVRQHDIAERNFTAAKQVADGVIFQVAQGLRNQEGMRTETVRSILGATEAVIGDLITSSSDNQELRRTQAGMLLEFADTYASQGDSAKQAEAVKSGVTILTRLVAADPANAGWRSDLAIAQSKRGDVFLFRGQKVEALDAYRTSLATLEALSAADPKDGELQQLAAAGHDRIARVLTQDGKRADALKEMQLSQSILEGLNRLPAATPEWQRDLGVSYQKTGEALQDGGKTADAIDVYRKALAWFQKLALTDPGNARGQHDIAIAQSSIGNGLQLIGNHAEALKSYQASFDSLDHLAKTDPSNADRAHDLAVARGHLADAAATAGNGDAALAMYRENIAQLGPWRARDPSNVQFQHSIGYALWRQGQLLAAAGKPVEARKSLEDGIAVTRRLLTVDAGNAAWQDDLALALTDLAPLESAANQPAEALATLQETLAIRERLALAEPANPDPQGKLATAYAAVGIQLITANRKDDGVVMMRKAKAAAAAKLARSPVDAKFKAFADKVDSVLKLLDQ